MKKLIKSTVVASVIFFSLSSFANDSQPRLSSENNGKSLILKMQETKVNDQVQLLDADTNIIYSEENIKDNYVKRFNLNNLESGLYFLQVGNLTEATTFTLKIANEGVSIISTKETKTKPVLRKVGDKVLLNLFNQDKKSVDIKILDGSDNVVHKQKVVGQLLVEKAFNFENAVANVYTVIVTDGDRTYYQNILIP